MIQENSSVVNMNNMKKTIFTIIFLICSIFIGGCSESNNISSPENSVTANPNNSPSNSVIKENPQNSSQPTKDSNISQQPSIKNENPSSGTIKDMQNGDLKCYVSVIDGNGKLYEGVGATFDVCEPDKYVNKNVNLFYELENVNDCQSAEPCGKTIKEWLITKIEIRD